MPSDITIAGDPFDFPHLAHLAAPTAAIAPTVARLTEIALDVADDPRSWRNAISFDLEQRRRIRLRAAEDHEVWLVSWLPGHRTGLHDHGDASAVFTVATGRLRERAVTFGPKGTLVETGREISPGEVRVFGPRQIRELINPGPGRAVSVHVYAPRLSDGHEYRFTGGALLRT